MSYRRHLSVVAAVLLAGFLVSGNSATAEQSTDLPTLSGPEVIHYAQDDSLSDVSRFVVQGKKNNGGCSFATTVDISNEDRSTGQKLVFNEIAYDPTRCLSLVEQGFSTKDNSPEDSESVGDGGSTEADGTTTDSNARRQAPPCTSFSGWCWYIGFHSWFEDPPGIHVNDVTNDISWPQDSTTCALPAGTSFGWGYLYQWFTGTNWHLKDHNVSHPGDCGSVRSSSYAYFLNDIFCPDNNWTHVYYDRNTIYGYAGGTAQGAINYDKNGACAGLLSYNWEYTFS